MKKFIVVFIIPVLLFLHLGCGEKGVKPVVDGTAKSMDTSDIKGVSLSGDESKNVMLKYQPEKGKTYNYRLTSITEDKGTMSSGDSSIAQKMNQEIKYLIAVKINDVESDGIIDASFNVRSVVIDATLDDKKKVHFETGGKADSAAREGFIDYEALAENPFAARLKPTGEVLEIYKVDKIVSKILSLRRISKDSLNAEELARFQTTVSDGALRPVVQQLFRNLSSNPVSKAETWSTQQPPMNLQIVVYENKIEYTLEDVAKVSDDVIAVINSKLVATAQINPEAKKRGISVNQAAMGGLGKIYFNLSKQVLQKTKSTMTVQRSMSALAPTPKGVQKVTQKVETKISNYTELIGIE